MFGASGQFAALLNKQRNEKSRKSSFRYQQQKKKENFLKEHPADLKTELEFPEVSNQKLEIIKREIRRRARTELFVKVGTYVVGTIVFFVLFWYWLTSE